MESSSTTPPQTTSLVQQWRQCRREQTGDRCRLALPNGSLQKATIEALNRAGYGIEVSDRALRGRAANDEELVINWYRSMEIPWIVAQGFADIGITGEDLVEEMRLKERRDINRNLRQVATFNYAKNSNAAWWVIAVNNGSPFTTLRDLVGGRIDSEILYTTRRLCGRFGVQSRIASSFERAQDIEGPGHITIVPSLGATEGKIDQIAEGIVTVTESGTSLTENNLRVIVTICRTRVALLLNCASRERGCGRKAKEIAIGLLDGAGLKGELTDDFDKDHLCRLLP